MSSVSSRAPGRRPRRPRTVDPVALLRALPEAVVVTDEERRLVEMNPAAEGLLGASRAVLLGRRLDDYVADDPPLPDAWAGPGGLHAGEVAVERPDGTRAAVEFVRQDLAPGLQVAVLRDVTPSRLAEEALAQEADALHRKAETLEWFSRAAAHDLKEPLRTSLALTQLLERDHAKALGPEGGAVLGEVLEGLTRLGGLLDGILAYARSGGDAPIRVRPVDLGRLARRAVASLGAALRESGGTVRVGSLPVVAGVEPQLEQVLQNLLANAIRYRGTDPPAIHVHGAEGAGEWILSVEDNGVGIPADALERVFDPFRRLASPDRAGSGLGLAICRQIVERHGGRIWAESLPRGTAFRFALPVVPSAGTAP